MCMGTPLRANLGSVFFAVTKDVSACGIAFIHLPNRRQ